MYDHGYFIARCLCTPLREAERSARVRPVHRWQQPTPGVSYRTSIDARLRRGISRSCSARSRRHPNPLRVQGGIALRGDQPFPTGRSHDDRDTPPANRERHHGTDRATQCHELATGSRFTNLSPGCVRHAQCLPREFQPRIFSQAFRPRPRQATGWILRPEIARRTDACRTCLARPRPASSPDGTGAGRAVHMRSGLAVELRSRAGRGRGPERCLRWSSSGSCWRGC